MTLAVEAAAQAMPTSLDAPASLIVAGTTLPYAKGSSVQPLAELLGIQGSLFAAELTATTRDGLAALRLASALTSAGTGPVLVCAAHAPDPGEPRAGAGAVALLIGDGDGPALAAITPAGASTEELRDSWQLASADSPRTADRSFVAQIGTERLARLALDAAGGQPGRAIIHGPDARAAGAVEEGLGDEAVGVVGSLGAAHPLLRILLGLDEDLFAVAIADGLAESIAVSPGPAAGEGIALARKAVESGVEGPLPSRRNPPEDFAPFNSPPRAWRERDVDLRLAGIANRGDGEPVPGRRAPTGTVITWVRDHVYPAAPVTDMAVVQLDDGGRHFGQVAAGEEVGIGDRVQLVPRRLHEGGDVVQYFWKVAPCR